MLTFSQYIGDTDIITRFRVRQLRVAVLPFVLVKVFFNLSSFFPNDARKFSAVAITCSVSFDGCESLL